MEASYVQNRRKEDALQNEQKGGDNALNKSQWVKTMGILRLFEPGNSKARKRKHKNSMLIFGGYKNE